MSDIYNSHNDKAYRFLSFESLYKTVENESLRFTRADSFNDPLDNSPLIAPFEWKEYKEFGHNFIESIINYSFNKIFSSIYICCFSKEYDKDNSYLMWSHYTDSHKGVCFEIDFLKNSDSLDTPSNVKYPNNLLTVRENLKTVRDEEKGLFLVTNKLNIWKYEKEVRLIIDTESEKFKFSTSTLSNDLKHLFFKFNPNVISKVIFGVKSKKIDESKIIELFKKKELNTIFEKMIIDPETLKLTPINYESYNQL